MCLLDLNFCDGLSFLLVLCFLFLLMSQKLSHSIVMSGRPVGIESIVASHLEVFIRTVSDDFLDESLNSFSDIDSFVILMTIIEPMNHFGRVIIFYNSAFCHDRSVGIACYICDGIINIIFALVFFWLFGIDIGYPHIDRRIQRFAHGARREHRHVSGYVAGREAALGLHRLRQVRADLPAGHRRAGCDAPL